MAKSLGMVAVLLLSLVNPSRSRPENSKHLLMCISRWVERFFKDYRTMQSIIRRYDWPRQGFSFWRVEDVDASSDVRGEEVDEKTASTPN